MLLFKFKKLGPIFLKMLQSYLAKRHQTVGDKRTLTNPINVASRLPEGCYIGPLLLVLFVNDISYMFQNVKVLINADDMKLY